MERSEIEAADFAAVAGPGFARVGALRLEQSIELGVARRFPGICEAERGGDAGRHMRLPARALAAADIIGGEALAAFELATGGVNRLRWLGLRFVLREVSADFGAVGIGRNFCKIEHVSRAFDPTPSAARGG